MAVDTYLSITSAIVQAMVLAMLIRKRIYKEFPLFSAYLIWIFMAACVSAFAATRMKADQYALFFLVSSIFDALFMLSILVEMSMSVLKPVKSMLPGWTTFAVIGVIGFVAIAMWHVANPPGMIKLSKMSQYNVRFDITSSMLRIMFFVSVAALSQLLSIGWRDRVVQMSTGLGFFSLVSLCVTFLHMKQGVGEAQLNALYHVLDRIVSVSYITSMLYWLFCFARDVPERQEFTPQMQTFIVTMARNARSVRLAVVNSEAKN